MRLLFICNQNKHRSKTAEIIFKDAFETKSAGLYNGTPLTKDLLEWAEVVIVMDDEQRKELGKRFPRQYLKKQILCMNIPDQFSFNQPELVAILRKRMQEIIPTIQ